MTEDTRSITDLELLAERVRQNNLSQSSRSVYAGPSIKFIQWILRNKQQLVPESFFLALTDLPEPDIQRRISSSVYNPDPENPPIHFDQLTAKTFMTWIVSLTKSDGSRPSNSYYNKHRASLHNLFRDYGKSFNSEFEKELKYYFRDLKRDDHLHLKLIELQGKDPLDFAFFMTALEIETINMLRLL